MLRKKVVLVPVEADFSARLLFKSGLYSNHIYLCTLNLRTELFRPLWTRQRSKEEMRPNRVAMKNKFSKARFIIICVQVCQNCKPGLCADGVSLKSGLYSKQVSTVKSVVSDRHLVQEKAVSYGRCMVNPAYRACIYIVCFHVLKSMRMWFFIGYNRI